MLLTDDARAIYVGSTPVRKVYVGSTQVWTCPIFPQADWLYTPIPSSPALDVSSSTWAGYLTSGEHSFDGYEYAVKVVGYNSVTGSTPRYDVAFTNVPGWGPDPYGSDTVPVPAGTTVPPGSDSHLAVIDPINNKVYGMWQAVYSGGNWTASWGGVADLDGNGMDTGGSARAARLSLAAGIIGADELDKAVTYNTGLNHALYVSCDCTSKMFVYPAQESDGDNAAAVARPIPQGKRLQLDPSVNVDAISGITAAEKVVAKTLQTHGAYIIDKGGARLAFFGELQPDGAPGDPGAAYTTHGLEWDYYDMNKIPWANIRVLRNWDGS